MPILYVHGVSIRDDESWKQIEALLRRYVAPTIATDPANVDISFCFWGGLGAKGRWAQDASASSPLKAILSKGATAAKEQAGKLARLKSGTASLLEKAEKWAELIPKDMTKIPKVPKIATLKDLSCQSLSDLCANVIQSNYDYASLESTLALMAADDIAYNPEIRLQLAKCRALEDELVLLYDLIRDRYTSVRSELGVQVASEPVLKLKLSLNVKHLFYQALHGPGSAVTSMAAEMRSPINRFVTLFLGDVFTYLSTRGSALKPGPIPQMLLDHLLRCQENKRLRQNEPLILMSHSMGGQLVYDMVTHFLPRMPEYKDIKIDFWCATASQVGFFEELKLFLESSADNACGAANSACGAANTTTGAANTTTGAANTTTGAASTTTGAASTVPFPNRQHLGYWWNVWDQSDLISYSTKDIFEDVDDESFNTGMFVVKAHSAYLCLPSFYRQLATKVEQAVKNIDNKTPAAT